MAEEAEAPPQPWCAGGKIPWNDPAFSRRMLREHLSQEHDAASRRCRRIDQQVQWLESLLPRKGGGRVLDLGCGPGLYTERLAASGHRCVGVDFSPASIAYAKERARERGLAIEYIEADLRGFHAPSGFDLILLAFGEFNTFPPPEAIGILREAVGAIAVEGRLVLEVHTLRRVEEIGSHPDYEQRLESGLFSDGPHTCRKDSAWIPEQRVCVERYRVRDLASGEITEYASTLQGYSDPEYRALFREAGLSDLSRIPSLSGPDSEEDEGLFVWTCGAHAGSPRRGVPG